jgi:hypothetical protein
MVRSVRSQILAGIAVLAAAAGLATAAAAQPAGAASVPATPAAAKYSVGLSSVACTSTKNCFASAYVSYSATLVETAPLIEKWNGTAWSLGTAPLPSGGKYGTVQSVTCPAATECVAVGSYSTATGGAAIPLAEVWHGKSWSPVKVPAGAAAKSGLGLSIVSCASATSCDITGTSYAGAGSPVAYTWNGKTFTEVTLPDPIKGDGFGVYGLSCPSATRCVAVGSYYSGGNFKAGWLAETWNGKAWSAVKLSSLASYNRALQAVSCTSTTHCIAVGDYPSSLSPTHYRAVADVLNGSRWTVTPLTAAATGDEYLGGLACTSATQCLAVGATETEFPYELTGIAYAESWNGKAWTVRKVPTLPSAKGPGSAQGSQFSAVSCPTATYCLAVGIAGPTGKGVSAVWTGKTWTTLATAAA